ncbi:52 kDa repressor of the inhibitor of the protein kinase, partial [Ooceraea biroi]
LCHCKNISERNSGIKFFRFPKDPEMSKLWIKVCNRTINRTADELYKNYRICSVHFNENMYLNDIRSRLLPRAIPNAITPNVMANNDTCIIPQSNIQ